jgi:hypothetical protein
MDRITAALAGLLLLFSLSSVRAGDAEDAQLAQRCPNFSAWQSAHPELSQKNRARHIKVARPAQPKLRLRLLQMVKADQAVRDAWIKAGMTGQAADVARRNMLAVDAANLRRLKPVVLRQGFPGPAQVGEDGVEAAFLLIQHADRDPVFQSRVLPQLAALHRQGLISGQDLALLTDRTLRAKGKPQRYGTQFISDESHPEMKLQPVEDISALDTRRARMGMPPIKDYACILGVMYHKPVRAEP